MANTVYESHTNEHVLFKFLTDLHALLDDKTVWGGHLGSETLMRRHKNTRTRIACITVLEKRKSELEQRKTEDAGTSIEELPEEVELRGEGLLIIYLMLFCHFSVSEKYCVNCPTTRMWIMQVRNYQK